MNDWNEIENKLYKKYTFSSFEKAIAFMAAAAVEIEKINHHPEWKNVYNRVEVWLCTHDAGNVVTEKDRNLSRILDAAFEHIS